MKTIYVHQIKTRELTESEKFMAGFIQSPCDINDCTIEDGMCDICFAYLKISGKKLLEFMKRN